MQYEGKECMCMIAKQLYYLAKHFEGCKPLWLCFIQEYVFFWELALCRLTHFALQSLGAPACHELVDSWMYVILILSEMSVPYLCAENFTVFVVS